MKSAEQVDTPETIRLDRLLVYLRFARTRSIAREMIECHAMRRNRQHVARVSESVQVGDVLTFMLGEQIKVIEVLSLPHRRASPAAAKALYRDLLASPTRGTSDHSGS